MEKGFYYCPFCGKKIKKGNGHHLKECDKFKEFLIKEKENIITKYCNEKYSILELSNEYNIPYSTIQKILNMNNITIRNVKESKETERTKEKYKETMMKNWGTPHNFSKNCESRKKWEKRLKDEEGITNVFQRKDVIDKIKKTLNEKYTEEEKYYNYAKGSTLSYWIEKLGEEDGLKKYQEICHEKGKVNRVDYWIEKLGEEEGEQYFKNKINKAIKKSIASGAFQSSLNKRFKKILDENNILYEQEKILHYIENNRRCYFSYDFLIKNTIFELNGDFWHANPSKYKENDILNYPYELKPVKKIWEHDEKKRQLAIDNNYRFVTIWENEFNKMSDSEILEIIKKEIL